MVDTSREFSMLGNRQSAANAGPYCVIPFLLPPPKNPCPARAEKASQAGRRRFDPGRPLSLRAATRQGFFVWLLRAARREDNDHDARRLAMHPSHRGRGVRRLPKRDGRTAEARRGRHVAQTDRQQGARRPPSGTVGTGSPRATGCGSAASAYERPPQASRLTNRFIVPDDSRVRAPRRSCPSWAIAPCPHRSLPSCWKQRHARMSKAGHILVVDRERRVGDAITAVLRRPGWSCHALGDARQVADALRKDALDVLVVDLGVAAYRKLLARRPKKPPSLPVLAVTGSPSLSLAVEVLNLGTVCRLPPWITTRHRCGTA